MIISFDESEYVPKSKGIKHENNNINQEKSWDTAHFEIPDINVILKKTNNFREGKITIDILFENFKQYKNKYKAEIVTKKFSDKLNKSEDLFKNSNNNKLVQIFFTKLLNTSMLTRVFFLRITEKLLEIPIVNNDDNEKEEWVHTIIDGGYLGHQSINLNQFDLVEELIEDPITKEKRKRKLDESLNKKLVKKQRFISVKSYNNNKNNEILILESNKIGETDLKIVTHISLIYNNLIKEDKEKLIILVNCKDTDLLPILLLHMREWLNPKTNNFPFEIYLDLRYKSEEEGNTIVNLNILWKSILNDFNEKYQNLMHPIEFLVFLMILTGTDYTNQLPHISQRHIISSIESNIHTILFEPNKVINSNEIEKKEISHIKLDKNLGGKFSLKTTDNKKKENFIEITEIIKGFIIPDYAKIGLPFKKHLTINFSEHMMYRFIQFLYHKLFWNNDLSIQKNIYKHDDMTYIRNEATFRNKTRPVRPYNIPNDNEIFAFIRRAWWNINYWSNADKIFYDRNYHDPLSMDKNESLYGYTQSRDVETGKTKIAFALQVKRNLV